MNPSPASAGPPELDWNRWAKLLQQFSAATGLMVSLYDERAVLRVGPLGHSALSSALAPSRLWAADGPGVRLESALARRCVASGRMETDTFCTELDVRAMPLVLAGEVRGVIVFGWVFCAFPTALANDRIAREAGLPAPRLWRQLRLESPISPARLTVLSDLLRTLVESNVQQTEAIEELQRLSDMRDVFLARVSHDLRTPLTAISLRIEALLYGALDDPVQIRQVLQSMQASIAEEARLIDDLIDAGRTRTGQMRIERTHTELAPILSEAVAAIRPQADKKSVHLHVHGIGPDRPHPIYADGSRLRQVFWNLLSNAVKFTPSEGDVTLEVRNGGGQYEVRVQDSGAGIEAELLPRVFDTFIKRAQDNDQGLGLGLPIAKHIVELHGGTVHASSDGDGRGTTMVVILPGP